MRSRKSTRSSRLHKHGNFEQLARVENAKSISMGDRYRRCHLCHHTTLSDQEVRRCGQCGRTFNPFYFFSETMIFVDADGVRPQATKGEFKALVGFTVLWSEADAIE